MKPKHFLVTWSVMFCGRLHGEFCETLEEARSHINDLRKVHAYNISLKSIWATEEAL